MRTRILSCMKFNLGAVMIVGAHVYVVTYRTEGFIAQHRRWCATLTHVNLGVPGVVVADVRRNDNTMIYEIFGE